MLSKKNKEALFNPFSKDNPVLVQILGICSTLAVTVNLEPAIVMGISVTAVLAFSNVIISLIRNTIPTTIRIIVQLGSEQNPHEIMKLLRHISSRLRKLTLDYVKACRTVTRMIAEEEGRPQLTEEDLQRIEEAVLMAQISSNAYWY